MDVIIKNKKTILFIVLGIIFGILVYLSSSIFETNEYGNYQIKQSVPSGNITVINKPGLYMQNFGYITTYKMSDEQNFDGLVDIRFNDGSTAKIKGILKFRLSPLEENQLKIHRDFRSYENFKNQLIKQTVMEALLQTGPFFKSTDDYQSKRAEFSSLAEQQIIQGLFETTTKSVKETDISGGEFIQNIVTINKNSDGSYKIRKKSPFIEYGVQVIQFSITDINFDSSTENLIAKRKEAEQQKVVAQSNAEKAKQDRLTIVEQGKAAVAKAEAEALIEQKTAIIKAEMERKVAEENAKKAKAEAQVIIEKGRAEAEANRLKVQAGLTPLEKAQIEKEKAIGVAHEISKIQFPKLMVIGGDNKGGQLDPFQAVGLESFMKITDKLSKE